MFKDQLACYLYSSDFMYHNFYTRDFQHNSYTLCLYFLNNTDFFFSSESNIRDQREVQEDVLDHAKVQKKNRDTNICTQSSKKGNYNTRFMLLRFEIH